MKHLYYTPRIKDEASDYWDRFFCAKRKEGTTRVIACIYIEARVGSERKEKELVRAGRSKVAEPRIDESDLSLARSAKTSRVRC